MIEIRTHGRGGQGAVIASKILAMAFFSEDKYVQSFPVFGVERRGAPVAAFTRVDTAPIRLRCNVYTPDHVVVLDATLMLTTNVAAGLKRGGTVLINSDFGPSEFARQLKGFRVATVDADAIARKYRLGSATAPIVNTTILGAFAAQTGLVKLESIGRAIAEEIRIKTEQNVQASAEAFRSLRA